MSYKNEKEMLFTFLNYYIDYSKSWDEIEYGMGYDLGDWYFKEIPQDRIYRMAKQLWIELNGIHNKITK